MHFYTFKVKETLYILMKDLEFNFRNFMKSVKSQKNKLILKQNLNKFNNKNKSDKLSVQIAYLRMLIYIY